MNDIVLIEKALRSSRIMEEKSNIVYNFLNTLVIKVFIIAGQAIDDDELLDFTVSELQKDVSTRYKALTLQEVDIALTNGVKGDYGEYYGLNIRSFNKFLNEYTFSEERMRAIEARMTRVAPGKQLAAKGSITREENERIAYNNALDLFESYKKTNECLDHGNVVYNHLDRLGLIKFNTDEKWEMFNRAKKWRDKERETLGRTSTISNLVEQQLEDDITVILAKKIALKRYFANLARNNVELKTILDKSESTPLPLTTGR